jgi:2-furoyl-CoA dehydrogenase large subunit
VTAQIIADVFGLTPAAIRVDPVLDTAKDAWSIAAGNYSSRFAGATAGAAYLAATRLRGRLARVAAAQLNVRPEDLCFVRGRIFAASNPENSLSFARAAAASHWFPGSLPDPEPSLLQETVFWSPSVLEAPNAADEINSSATYSFVFDFCGLEIDRDTGVICIDKFVSLHDAGHILNPALFDGQVRGGFAMAIGAALYERFVYAEDGGLLTGSFADYAVPTASMIPEFEILHMESSSPVTPLGAKGVAEGNAMSTPVCIANAVADALGVAEISLPLTPERMLGGVIAVVDLVGSDKTAALALSILRNGGTYVSVGLFGGTLNVPLAVLNSRQISIWGSRVGTPQELRDLVHHVRSGSIKPIPVKHAPISSINEGLAALREGKITGRIVHMHAAVEP